MTAAPSETHEAALSDERPRNTDAERVSDIVAALHRSITTASNDDLSEPTSDKRSRHVARIIAMSEALVIIEAQSKALAEARAKLDIADDCDGTEQDAFEAWAEKESLDMSKHPLHWLFLDTATNAARRGWRAGITHARKRLLATATPTPENPNG